MAPFVLEGCMFLISTSLGKSEAMLVQSLNLSHALMSWKSFQSFKSNTVFKNVREKISNGQVMIQHDWII